MNLLTQLATVTRFVSDGTKDAYGHESAGATSTVYTDYPCRVYMKNLGAVAPGKEFERGANMFLTPNMLAMETGVALERDDVATVEGVAWRVAGGGDVMGHSTSHHSEWLIERVV